jgi:hypothetical protein
VVVNAVEGVVDQYLRASVELVLDSHGGQPYILAKCPDLLER